MLESDGESGDVVEATLDDGGAGRFARVAAGESAEFGDPKDDLGDGGRRERFWVRPLLVLLSEGDSGHEFPLGEDVGGGGVRFVPGEVFELTAEESRTFAEALLRPRAPTSDLKAAARRYIESLDR